MIDCGADWLGRLPLVEPTSIVLTHAHPDHAFGLERGASCPVYATTVAWDALNSFPVFERRKMPLANPIVIDGVQFEAFPVEHSVRAPAVGYRVSIGSSHFFYVPDVAQLPHSKVLREIDLYIGDGALQERFDNRPCIHSGASSVPCSPIADRELSVLLHLKYRI